MYLNYVVIEHVTRRARRNFWRAWFYLRGRIPEGWRIS